MKRAVYVLTHYDRWGLGEAGEGADRNGVHVVAGVVVVAHVEVVDVVVVVVVVVIVVIVVAVCIAH